MGCKLTKVVENDSSSHPVIAKNSNYASNNQKEGLTTSAKMTKIIPKLTNPTQKVRKIEDVFKIVKELGKGQYSIVYDSVYRPTEKRVALKSINRTEMRIEEIQMLDQEITILRRVQGHPRMVQLVDVYESEDQPHLLYLVMEVAEGGELFDRIVGHPRWNEASVARLMRALLEAVLFLHSQGIVHRDLKPENLLCAGAGDRGREEVRLGDFGFAKEISSVERLTDSVGTMSYAAPELLEGIGYNKEVDLWSCGIILFLLLCGSFPFDGKDDLEIANSTVNDDIAVDPDVWDGLSREAKSLIGGLLKKNPSERFTAEKAIKHSFLAKYGVSMTTSPTLTQPTSSETTPSSTPPSSPSPKSSTSSTSIPILPPPPNDTANSLRPPAPLTPSTSTETDLLGISPPSSPPSPAPTSASTVPIDPDDTKPIVRGDRADRGPKKQSISSMSLVNFKKLAEETPQGTSRTDRANSKSSTELPNAHSHSASPAFQDREKDTAHASSLRPSLTESLLDLDPPSPPQHHQSNSQAHDLLKIDEEREGQTSEKA